MWIDQLNELLNGPWGPLAITLGVGGLLILLAYGLYQLNLYLIRKGTHPAVVELLNKAIALAWQASEAAVDAGMDRLHGLDKKVIADGLYDTGGDLLVHLQLRFLPISVDLRNFITREQFASFVQARFDDMTDGLQDILDQMDEQGPPEAEDDRITLPVESHSVRRPPDIEGPGWQ
jgi:hypothetical protein